MITLCNVIVEIIKGLGYSLIGFLIGYNFCKARRCIEEIKEVIVDEDENLGSAPKRRKVIMAIDDWQGRIIGIIVLILSIFTVSQSVYFTNARNDERKIDQARTDCQAKFNDDFAKAVVVRAQYQDEDRTQLYKMIVTIMGGGTQAERAKAVRDWIATTDKNDKLRAQTPLPKLESRNCG